MSDTSRGPATVRCCIAGGGPAGMMLGLLLARAGVDVLVPRKRADRVAVIPDEPRCGAIRNPS